VATLRAIRRRIASVKKTQQITRAMQMVAAAKLRRAQEGALKARPYGQKLSEMVKSLAARTKPESHPLLSKREEKKISVVVITSDRGLCGAFNLSILTRATKLLKEKRAAGCQVDLSVIGRKGIEFFRRRGEEIKREYRNVLGSIDYAAAAVIGSETAMDFSEGTIDTVYLVYNQFKSVLQQQVVEKKLLPLEDEYAEDPSSLVEYIFEPKEQEILDLLLPRYVEYETFVAILESTASEFAARMTAMDLATRNAKEMIEKLTLFFNRARQNAITRELMDIVGGAEALQK